MFMGFSYHIETMLVAHCFWAFSSISNFYTYLFSFFPCMMLSDYSVPLVAFFFFFFFCVSNLHYCDLVKVSVVTHTRWWSLVPSVTYIRLGEILLLS